MRLRTPRGDPEFPGIIMGETKEDVCFKGRDLHKLLPQQMLCLSLLPHPHDFTRLKIILIRSEASCCNHLLMIRPTNWVSHFNT